MDVTGNFTEKDEQLYFTGTYMEAYIPKFYFDEGLAVENGRDFEIFGVFNFKVFKTEDRNEKAVMHTLKMPNTIVISPSSVSKSIENLTGEANSEGEEVMIFKFFKNDLFIKSLSIVQDVDSCEKFVKLINGGKLPPSLSYNDILDLWFMNLEINNEGLGVPSLIMELIISEIYRDKKDISQPFRFRIGGNGKVSPYDYKTVNLKTIANANSTFTALTFEDIDYALTNSVNKTRYNEKETPTPIEKTIKY